VAIPLTLLVIVGVINAINLADGLDGLAGGITLLVFCLIGYLAYQAENTTIVFLSLAMIGAIFGFLRFNTFPATIFMGDSGSQLLGFAAITSSLALTQTNTPLSPLLPLIILGFPVLDTLYVMGSRIRKGISPFVADKNHFHHKLIQLGFFHTEAVLIIYFIQAVLVTLAYFLRFQWAWLLLIVYVFFSGSILTFFYIADQKHWKIRRYDLIDRGIKGHLRTLVDKGLLIVACSRIVEIGVPLLFLFTCFLPREVPRYFLFVALAISAIILATWFFKKDWFPGALRLIYLLIPFILFFCERSMVSWMTGLFHLIYIISYGVIAFFLILTLKFTRREKGFRFNPMDFLIFFIVLSVPFLQETRLQEFNLWFLTVKVILLLFSYEVLLGELRGENKRIFYPTIGGLIIFIVRGFMG
jgi:UDP-GlcNAc:undecaprenyl-phosphate GlcNAc-1-phosphate transferase